MVSIFDTIAEQEESRLTGTMKRATQLRQDLNHHERQMIRLFERIQKQTEEAAAENMVVDFPLSPELTAAYKTWCEANEGADVLLTKMEAQLRYWKGEPQLPTATEWAETQREAPIGPELP